ncbi:MAG TPA: acylphosphatase [Gemmataceae bacterium]|jgi:acylphosphatase|nr:acylphosphatase [Gemmataceae bacterium]
MTVCKRVYYSGRVQGVGFRYAAQSLAEDFDVSGYVRNLPGGDVELVAEGRVEQVDAFLDTVARRMAGHIERTTVREESPGGYKGFRIRY